MGIVKLAGFVSTYTHYTTVKMKLSTNLFPYLSDLPSFEGLPSGNFHILDITGPLLIIPLTLQDQVVLRLC